MRGFADAAEGGGGFSFVKQWTAGVDVGQSRMGGKVRKVRRRRSGLGVRGDVCSVVNGQRTGRQVEGGKVEGLDRRGSA